VKPRSPTPAAPDRRRGGFTLVELLLVVAIVGILAQIAIPNYRNLVTRARAVDVLGDIEVIEQGARNFQGDRHLWPPDAAPGVIPPGLATYLPDAFSFTGEDFQLDWENIDLPGGLPGDPGTSRILGVGVVTGNAELAEALVAIFGQAGWYVVGSTYVRIIERE
jgi:prepilin-type N-terminal cleavage/methylation domain-containing protein